MASCRKTQTGLHLHLEANEVDLIRFLGKKLRRLMEHGDSSQSGLRSFYPSQQRERDPESVPTDLEGEMDRELMHLRLRRIESIQNTLLNREDADAELDVILDETQTDIWLAYLADLRLLLSAVIGITPENPDPFMDRDREDWTMEMNMYEFLSVLQEWLLAT
ncbi:MAG: DUF2017 family protein [Kiritimatiellia bacterium]